MFNWIYGSSSSTSSLEESYLKDSVLIDNLPKISVDEKNRLIVNQAEDVENPLLINNLTVYLKERGITLETISNVVWLFKISPDSQFFLSIEPVWKDAYVNNFFQKTVSFRFRVSEPYYPHRNTIPEFINWLNQFVKAEYLLFPNQSVFIFFRDINIFIHIDENHTFSISNDKLIK